MCAGDDWTELNLYLTFYDRPSFNYLKNNRLTAIVLLMGRRKKEIVNFVAQDFYDGILMRCRYDERMILVECYGTTLMVLVLNFNQGGFT